MEIKIESPIRFEKKKNVLRIETDKLVPNTCKIVPVKKGWIRSEKLLVCVGKNTKDITIKPLKKTEK